MFWWKPKPAILCGRYVGWRKFFLAQARKYSKILLWLCYLTLFARWFLTAVPTCQRSVHSQQTQMDNCWSTLQQFQSSSDPPPVLCSEWCLRDWTTTEDPRPAQDLTDALQRHYDKRCPATVGSSHEIPWSFMTWSWSWYDMGFSMAMVVPQVFPNGHFNTDNPIRSPPLVVTLSLFRDWCLFCCWWWWRWLWLECHGCSWRGWPTVTR